MSYIDGFVAAVPTANRETYRAHADAGRRRLQGARRAEVRRVLGRRRARRRAHLVPDGGEAPAGRDGGLRLDRLARKAARDAGMAKVMADPRMQPDVEPMPFDGKRLIYGGFETIVEA